MFNNRANRRRLKRLERRARKPESAPFQDVVHDSRAPNAWRELLRRVRAIRKTGADVVVTSIKRAASRPDNHGAIPEPSAPERRPSAPRLTPKPRYDFRGVPSHALHARARQHIDHNERIAIENELHARQLRAYGVVPAAEPGPDRERLRARLRAQYENDQATDIDPRIADASLTSWRKH